MEAIKGKIVNYYNVKKPFFSIMISGEKYFPLFIEQLIKTNKTPKVGHSIWLFVDNDNVIGYDCDMNHTYDFFTVKITDVSENPEILYNCYFKNNVYKISRKLINNHPRFTLEPGSEIRAIVNKENQVIFAKIISENKKVKCIDVDQQQSIITVKDNHDEFTKIKISKSNELIIIKKDESAKLIIEYHPDGSKSYSIISLAPPQKPSKSSSPKYTKDARDKRHSPNYNLTKNTSPYKNKETKVPSLNIKKIYQTQDPPTETKISGEMFGIDRDYFQERKKENHRFEIMHFLEEHLDDNFIEWYKMVPQKEPVYKKPVKPFPQKTKQLFLQANPHFTDFYSHQAEAYDQIRSGKNIVIVTPTASGKTLSFNPAIFQAIHEDPSTCALYVYPLNALLKDQKEKIDQLIKINNKTFTSITSEILIGEIPFQKRPDIIKSTPNILIVNPELLNSILKKPYELVKFLKRLKFVVLDEVHSYKGLLGLHMSGILRRLILFSNLINNQPQFILCSATINNPLDLAERLTPLPKSSFALITETMDGSRQAFKHWCVINPATQNLQKNINYDAHVETAATVMVDLLCSTNSSGKPSPLHTITFAKSFKEVNRIFDLVKKNLRQRGRAELIEKIDCYKSAELDYDEKTKIYNHLKTGKILGIVSTNALEAGIDLGILDACIIAGFPRQLMSFRQMAGRIGRTWEGLVIFVPQEANVVDQYYRDKPDRLLNDPPELFVIDPNNPYIAKKHIQAAIAASRKGLTIENIQNIWGDKSVEICEQAIRDKIVFRDGNKLKSKEISYKDLKNPYTIHQSIRSNQQENFIICTKDNNCKITKACFDEKNKQCKRRITILEKLYAYRDAFPGAIYQSPQDDLYKIISFDKLKKKITAEKLPENSLERTFVEKELQINIKEETEKTIIAEGIHLHWGKIEVIHNFSGYFEYHIQPKKRCRRCKQEFDQEIDLCPSCFRPTELYFDQSSPKRNDFPIPWNGLGFATQLETIGCWLTIDPKIEGKLNIASRCKLPGDQNKVLHWLLKPKNQLYNHIKIKLSNDEISLLNTYYDQYHTNLSQNHTKENKVLFPGIYAQCLLKSLRDRFGESRSLEIFEVLSGYPVTQNLRHICRKCFSPNLFEGLHTLNHTITKVYPMIAVGDRDDLSSYTTIGHPETLTPTCFWYDQYQGGIGAAEKVFTNFKQLLNKSLELLGSCNCTKIEGCPKCSSISNCTNHNESLNKAAGFTLGQILSKQFQENYFWSFYYQPNKEREHNKSYKNHEFVKQDIGLGEESPTIEKDINPYELLNVQPVVHLSVLKKAFEIRGKEIIDEDPPLSITDLSKAFHMLLPKANKNPWHFTDEMTPYQILEILPGCSFNMVTNVYRVIIREVHPDTNPGKSDWANRMSQIVNDAFEKIKKEKLVNYEEEWTQ